VVDAVQLSANDEDNRLEHVEVDVDAPVHLFYLAEPIGQDCSNAAGRYHQLAHSLRGIMELLTIVIDHETQAAKESVVADRDALEAPILLRDQRHALSFTVRTMFYNIVCMKHVLRRRFTTGMSRKGGFTRNDSRC
jgi:hypothetical protein